MIRECLEPKGLDRMALPCGEYRSLARHREDAVKGSRKLRRAIMKLQRPPARRCRPLKGGRPRTWAARKIARAKMADIQTVCAAYFKITVAELTGPRGNMILSKQRMIAMFLCRGLTTASYPDIGYVFGGRNHATVIHACREVQWDTEALSVLAVLRGMCGT